MGYLQGEAERLANVRNTVMNARGDQVIIDKVY